MTINIKGYHLIDSLVADSARFNDSGSAYDLLQEYFHGLPIATLSPLLRSSDLSVVKAAVWVLSELGKYAGDLMYDAIPLLELNDRYIKYHVLEAVAVCSVGNRTDQYRHVVFAMEDHDEVVAALAMRLVSRATEEQIHSSKDFFCNQAGASKMHCEGLSLLGDNDSMNYDTVSGLLSNSDSVVRKYGAILAAKTYKENQQLFDFVIENDDPCIRYFGEAFLRRQ